MFEISLEKGLGPINFGSKPSDVYELLGVNLYYEDWMGGNLENFLYYKGLLIGFRGEVEDHPTENSSVCMFQVKTVHPLIIWGQEITNLTAPEIESLLRAKKLKYTSLTNGIIQCSEVELQFHFNSGGTLDEVYFAN